MRNGLAVLAGLLAGASAFIWWGLPEAAPSTVTSLTAPATAAPAPTTTEPQTSECVPVLAVTERLILSPGVEAIEDLFSRLSCLGHVVVADSRDPFAVTTGETEADRIGGVMLLWPDHLVLIQSLDIEGATVVGLVPDDVWPGASRILSSALARPPAPNSSGSGVMVLTTAVSDPDAAVVRALGRASGWDVVFTETDDLRSLDSNSAGRVQATAPANIVVTDHDTATANWMMDVVERGLEIPGGGQIMFPGRRIVALYGSPGYPSLGVMGEQPPAEAVERAKLVAEGYGDDGTPIVAGFEIIATIASAGPGADGDYSGELALDEIRPWIEEAGLQGLYVILDLQPGRTDFLTQAKLYEEFLRLPHVGLALDPEWRLGPTQVHLRQIGTVDAAEINTVVDWLAQLVRDEALPQKMLLLHQFKLSMITNRELIRTPQELAVVIQMDGQGPLGTKYDTWDALLNAGPNPGWSWGWKNFYDEDSPMATPPEVLALDPIPVLVTFQ